MMFARLFALIILGGLSIVILGRYVVILIGIIILYFLIRWGADIFWWGKDKGKW